MISEILQYTFGGVYPGDFLSILRLAFRDYEKNVSRLSKRLNDFLQNLIEEHRASSRKGGGRSTDTMVDHLLSLQDTQPDYYTDEIIKGLIMVMIVGGTDTSTTTMEWALSFLTRNPNSLKRATEELDCVIGQECLIDETDIAKLPYLQSIVSGNSTFETTSAISSSTHVIRGLHHRRL
ncbi:hypothetical protein NL676_022879 [Syzygium grande]|nr:hypothetical protein NL676_022879 [Syzygium grande]